MPTAFCACRWGTETLTPDSLQGENKLKIRHRIFPTFFYDFTPKQARRK